VLIHHFLHFSQFCDRNGFFNSGCLFYSIMTWTFFSFFYFVLIFILLLNFVFLSKLPRLTMNTTPWNLWQEQFFFLVQIVSSILSTTKIFVQNYQKFDHKLMNRATRDVLYNYAAKNLPEYVNYFRLDDIFGDFLTTYEKKFVKLESTTCWYRWIFVWQESLEWWVLEENICGHIYVKTVLISSRETR
jgi:hypothetical protein